ncbi:MAG: ATP-binding protein [Promethearchaeota archaeon]
MPVRIPKNFHHYIDISPIVIFIWSNEIGTPVEYVSKNISNYGYTPEEFLSNKINYADFVHPDDLPRTRAESRLNLKNKVSKFSMHYRVLTKSGDVRYVQDETWAEYDAKGNIMYHCGFIIDQTTEVRLQQQLEIRQRMDYLANISGGLVHNFNNILSIIMGNSALLGMDNGNFTPDQLESLEEISRATERARDIVIQLQNFTQGINSPQQVVDLFDIVEKVDSLMQSPSHNSIKKENLVTPNQFFVSVVPTEIHQLFFNLCSNSIDAIEAHTVTSQDFIRITATPEANNMVHIQFTDSGIGISDDHMKQLFHPFFTTKATSEKSKGGQGLGLAMVYNIVTNKYQGKITVESQVNQGTTFHIYLPTVANPSLGDQNTGKKLKN